MIKHPHKDMYGVLHKEYEFIKEIKETPESLKLIENYNELLKELHDDLEFDSELNFIEADAPANAQLVVRTEAIRVFEDSLNPDTEGQHKGILSESKEQTYLAIIAALLESTLSTSGKPITQDSLAHDIESKYGYGNNGLSHSQLTKLFPKAKKALEEKIKK